VFLVDLLVGLLDLQLLLRDLLLLLADLPAKETDADHEDDQRRRRYQQVEPVHPCRCRHGNLHPGQATA
jgi:hypothetical protein